MPDTPLSLIYGLARQPTEEAWKRWLDLYDPLLRRWLIRFGLQASDVDDVVQEIFQYVVKTLPDFHHEGRPGAFRGWLLAILRNRVKELWASRRRFGGTPLSRELEELEDPNSPLSRLWNQEHDEHIRRRLLEIVQGQVSPTVWQAFELRALKGLSAKETAARLGIEYTSVISYKSRVLKLLREESKGLLD